MLIGVVSDTHGHLEYALNAVRMLEEFEVEAVLHCGDVGSAGVVKAFSKWPTHFVCGNVDNPAAIRKACEAATQTFHDDFGVVELAGKRIALLHSDDARRFTEVCDCGEYDLVCYGHTHVAKQERRGKTLILNPGALYRATPHSLAIVRLPEVVAEIIRV